MQEPHYGDPIPSPDGRMAPQNVLPVDRSDWKSAPRIVRDCGGILPILGILFGVIMMGVGFFEGDVGMRIFCVVFGAFLIALNFWLRGAMRKGLPIAWTVQIILSALGVFSFPLGTIIHGYILFHWFKPETKAWFGQQA
jgi:hypothetical protein